MSIRKHSSITTLNLFYYITISRIYFVLFLFFSANNYCQNSLIHYNTRNGLPHDVTYGVFQDNDGFIWIGTDDGLVKFDGVDFKTYKIEDGLKSNFVIDIAQLQNDKIVVSTWGAGIHIVDKDTIYKPKIANDDFVKIANVLSFKNTAVSYSSSNEFRIYNFNEHPPSLKFLKKKSENKIFNTNNSLLIKSNLALSKTNDSIYIHNKPFLESKNTLYGIYNLSGDEPFSFLQNEVVNAFTKIDSTFLAATKNDFIFFDQKKIIHRIPINFQNPVTKVLQSPVKNEFIALTTNENGFKKAYLYNTNTNSTTELIDYLNLESHISDIMFDHEGNLWLTTFGNGVFCYRYIETEKKTLLKNLFIVDLIKDNDFVYALTPNNLFKINSHNFKTIEKHKLQGLAISLSKVRDTICVNAANVGYEKKIHKSYNVINGTLFNESYYGIVKRHKKLEIGSVFSLLDKTLFYKKVLSKNDTLFLATNKGLFFYNPTKNILEAHKQINNTINNININDFLIKNKKKYLATDNGLYIVSNNNVKHYNKNNGLNSSGINGVLIDSKNKLWLATQQGISIFRNGLIENYNQYFGLLSQSINKLVEDNYNRVWVGGNKGIDIFKNNFKTNVVAPILNTSLENKTIKYQVITYSSKEQITTQYKINNDKWINLKENKGRISLSDYNVGFYKVIIRAKKNNSNWVVSSPLKISIAQVWYRKWWVIVFFIATLLMLTSLFHKRRLKAVKSRNLTLQNIIKEKETLQKELEIVRDNIAKDFHDDLGNRLARITTLSDLMIKTQDKRAKKDLLNAISKIKGDSDLLYSGTRDFMFSLKPQSDYLEEVFTYLSDYAQEYFTPLQIDFFIDKNIDNNYKLPHYWCRHIIMIFKEAMTNTVKYAEADEVHLNFTAQNNVLTISFSDNGKGFDVTEVKSTRGVLNMQQRAEKIGTELQIDTSKKGTKITLASFLPN